MSDFRYPEEIAHPLRKPKNGSASSQAPSLHTEYQQKLAEKADEETAAEKQREEDVRRRVAVSQISAAERERERLAFLADMEDSSRGGDGAPRPEGGAHADAAPKTAAKRAGEDTPQRIVRATQETTPTPTKKSLLRENERDPFRETDRSVDIRMVLDELRDSADGGARASSGPNSGPHSLQGSRTTRAPNLSHLLSSSGGHVATAGGARAASNTQQHTRLSEGVHHMRKLLQQQDLLLRQLLKWFSFFLCKESASKKSKLLGGVFSGLGGKKVSYGGVQQMLEGFCHEAGLLGTGGKDPPKAGEEHSSSAEGDERGLRELQQAVTAARLNTNTKQEGGEQARELLCDFLVQDVENFAEREFGRDSCVRGGDGNEDPKKRASDVFDDGFLLDGVEEDLGGTVFRRDEEVPGRSPPWEDSRTLRGTTAPAVLDSASVAVVQQVDTGDSSTAAAAAAPSEQQDHDGEIIALDNDKVAEEVINTVDAGKSRYFTDFEEMEHLGSGAQGDVFKVRNRLDGNVYAVKNIRIQVG